MAHIAILVFVIQLHLIYICTENVRNVEKHYAMFTESEFLRSGTLLDRSLCD